jgi:hypothetical protein
MAKRKTLGLLRKMGKTRLLAVVLVGSVLVLQTMTIKMPAIQACSSTVSSVEGNLDVQVTVGSIYFRGEMAEFYILVSYLGEPVDNASISASLYYNGALDANLSTSVEYVSAGLYAVPYTIPINASTGTYAMVVKATQKTCSSMLSGMALESFLLSPTLTGWNAWLVGIQGNITIIKTDVGTIEVSLEGINAALGSINGGIATIETNIGSIQTDISSIKATLKSVNGTMATIQTNIGEIQVNLSQINAKLVALNGTVATVQTSVGEIQVSLSQINATLVELNGTAAIIRTDVETIKTSINDIDLSITKIQGNIATITTTLGEINGTIISIQGNIATINTNIGEIKTSLPSKQTTTLGLPIVSILAAVAAIASITSVAILLRKREETKY